MLSPWSSSAAPTLRRLVTSLIFFVMYSVRKLRSVDPFPCLIKLSLFDVNWVTVNLHHDPCTLRWEFSRRTVYAKPAFLLLNRQYVRRHIQWRSRHRQVQERSEKPWESLKQTEIWTPCVTRYRSKIQASTASFGNKKDVALTLCKLWNSERRWCWGTIRSVQI